MAREFILFVHIYHWIGGETAVPFKTSPGLLTECHRDKMNTSGEWGGVGGGAALPLPRWESAQTWHWDAFFSFSPRNTNLLATLGSTFQEAPPPVWARIFSRFCTFLWILVHVWDECVFQPRRTMGKIGKRDFGKRQPPTCQVWEAQKGLAAWLFVASVKGLPNREMVMTTLERERWPLR